MSAPFGTDALRVVTVAWFETGMPSGPALGQPETMTWVKFVSIFEHHRDWIEKDGPCVAAARFKLENDGRHVRRLGANVIARTVIFLDIEANKKTGEVPPSLAEATQCAKALGLAALGYNSYSHTNENVRYRLALPLDREVAPELPAVEIIAEQLGLLGVLDMSKRGAASVFYLPARPYEAPDGLHQTIVVAGAPVDAAWLETAGGAILAARQAEAARIAATAHAEAAARLQARIAAGFNPDDSLIEKLRSRFDLDGVSGPTATTRPEPNTAIQTPNPAPSAPTSKSSAALSGIFSHNGTDPLHRDNLPAWCGGVTALDAFDVVTILDFGGDRDPGNARTRTAVQPDQAGRT